MTAETQGGSGGNRTSHTQTHTLTHPLARQERWRAPSAHPPTLAHRATTCHLTPPPPRRPADQGVHNPRTLAPGGKGASGLGAVSVCGTSGNGDDPLIDRCLNRQISDLPPGATRSASSRETFISRSCGHEIMVAPSPLTVNTPSSPPPHPSSSVSDFTDTFSSKICIGVTVSHSLLRRG